MSAADFLFAPEVQKLLTIIYAHPDRPFTLDELSKRSKLVEDDAKRTLEHLVKSGMLKRRQAKADEPETVAVNASFVFHKELRNIALKSFAAAEPVRAMLRARFKDSVVRAYLMSEGSDGSVELLIVHGQLIPDEAAMRLACQKLSKAIHRPLKVDVVSNARFDTLALREGIAAKLEAGSVLELIGLGDTKARLPQERVGLLQSARKKLGLLPRPAA